MQKIALRSALALANSRPRSRGRDQTCRGTTRPNRQPPLHTIEARARAEHPAELVIAVAAEIMKDQRFGAIEQRALPQLHLRYPRQRAAFTALINRLLRRQSAGLRRPLRQARRLDLERDSPKAPSRRCARSPRKRASSSGTNCIHGPAARHGRRHGRQADPVEPAQQRHQIHAARRRGPRRHGLGSVDPVHRRSGHRRWDERRSVAAAPRAEVPREPAAGTRRTVAASACRWPCNLAGADGARLEIDSTPSEGTAVALIFPKDRVAPLYD